MKNLKAFMEDLTKDNKLAKKFETVVEPQKVVEMAKKEGYEFTVQEYEDLAMAAAAGGGDLTSLANGTSSMGPAQEPMPRPQIPKDPKKKQGK